MSAGAAEVVTGTHELLRRPNEIQVWLFRGAVEADVRLLRFEQWGALPSRWCETRVVVEETVSSCAFGNPASGRIP